MLLFVSLVNNFDEFLGYFFVVLMGGDLLRRGNGFFGLVFGLGSKYFFCKKGRNG